jgi:hypothetical protein
MRFTDEKPGNSATIAPFIDTGQGAGLELQCRREPVLKIGGTRGICATSKFHDPRCEFWTFRKPSTRREAADARLGESAG